MKIVDNRKSVENLIDIGIFVNFYFTKYLMIGGVILGIMKAIRMIIIGKEK